MIFATQSKNNEEEQCADITIGFGTAIAVPEADTVKWALPGGEFTYCPEEAFYKAQKIDNLVRANMKRFSKNLV